MVSESWRAQFGTINPLTIGIAAECVFFFLIFGQKKFGGLKKKL